MQARVELRESGVGWCVTPLVCVCVCGYYRVGERRKRKERRGGEIKRKGCGGTTRVGFGGGEWALCTWCLLDFASSVCTSPKHLGHPACVMWCDARCVCVCVKMGKKGVGVVVCGVV